MSILYMFLRYPLLMVTILIWLGLIMLTEHCYTILVHVLLKKRKENMYRKIYKFYFANYSLPEQGYRKTVIFTLALAFALFCSIFACVPFGIGVPIIENGGDLLQMLFAIILSVGCVFISLEALNFSDKKNVFKKLIVTVARLYIPFAACIISIASYLKTIGVAGDSFSLALLTETTPYYAMHTTGIAGLILFGFIIFSQVYSEDKAPGEDCMLISVNDMPDFSGKTRFILQLWSLCIPYFVILLIEEIFFPWKFFVQTQRGPLIAMLISLAGVVLFWAGAVVIRILIVGPCWWLMHIIKTHVPAKVYFLILPLLTFIAMWLVFYDSINVAAEMIAY